MNNRKKICFIVSAPGTACAFLRRPIEKLSNYFDVYVVANGATAENLAQLKLSGFKDIPISRRPSPLMDLKALSILTQYFKDEKFDAVHSITKKASLLTTFAARWAKVPHRIHHFTGQMWCTMTGFRRRFYRYLDVIISRHDTNLLVDGYSQLKYLEENKIFPVGNASVLGHGSICGADTDRFAPNPAVRKELRDSIGISDNKVVFVFLGRLKREKGIGELLLAFDEILETCEDAFLLLVGVDEENWSSRLSDYKHVKNGENVVCYGKTPRPEALLAASDIFVLPTYREGFGVSVLEASSTGLPVICSDTYGVMDAMKDDITGLRCKTYDVKSLAKCMIKLYSDEDLRKELGEHGRDFVLNYFSADFVSDEWLKYYQEVLR